jgi:hypothetical protein
MNKAFIFIFASLTYSSWAFEKPPHCEAYDNIYSIRDGDAVKSDGSTFQREESVSRSCVAGELFDLSVDDLLGSWNNVNDVFLNRRDDVYQKRATIFAMKNLASRASEYEGLAGAKGEDFSPELVSCLNQLQPGLADQLVEKRAEQAAQTQPLTEDFQQITFDKAMLATSLINVINMKKSRHQANLDSAKSWSLRGRAARREKRQEIEEEFRQSMAPYKEMMEEMTMTDPLLFSTENDFSLGDWFNRDIVPSNLTKELLGNFPDQLQRKLNDSLKEPEEFQGLKGFVQAYGTEHKDEINSYKARHLQANKDKINAATKEATEKFVNDTNSSLATNCANGGEYLHYNNNLIGGLAETIFDEAELDGDQKQEELIALQAWHCHAWRKRPYKETGGLTKTRIGGFALMGAGAVAFLTTPFTGGAGAVAGSYAMMAAGALLTGNEVRDYIVQRHNINQERTGFQLGWRDLASLNSARDQRSDIVTNIGTDVALVPAGIAMRFTRLPRSFQRGRSAVNNGVRDSASTPEQAIDDYYKLIADRHDRVLPTQGVRDQETRLLQAATGNTTIPKVLLRDENGDFAPMYRLLTDTKGTIDDRNQAFLDLQKRIDEYTAYPDNLREAVRSGINIRQIQDANTVYRSALKRSHFPAKPGDPIPDLPELPSPYKVTKSPNNAITLHYQTVQKMEDGTEKLVDHTEDFATYARFRKFLDETTKSEQDAFSYSLADEAFRNSDIFAVLDRQARLHRELNVVRSGLIDSGNNVDANGIYRNLSQRQNDAIKNLNTIMLNSSELLPRADAVRAFAKTERSAERRAILTGTIFSGKGGKYSAEARAFATESIPGFARRYAPMLMVGTSTITGTGLALTSISNRVGLRGLQEDFNETMRDIGRRKNSYLFPESPVGFTNEEKACAEEARAWSIENACLVNIINTQVLVREGLREQLDPSYDLTQDEDARRKVRNYIRDFLRLREFFAAGEKTQLAQEEIRRVAQERTQEELKDFIKDVALQNGLLIMNENTGVIAQDEVDRLQVRLLGYESDPTDAAEAYAEILAAFEGYQSSVVQNPEIPANLRNLIERTITEQVVKGVEQEE